MGEERIDTRWVKKFKIFGRVTYFEKKLRKRQKEKKKKNWKIKEFQLDSDQTILA